MQLLWLTQKWLKIMSEEGSGLCRCVGRVLVHQALSLTACGSEASKSLWRLSKTLTLKYLLLANWLLTGKTLDTEMKIVMWEKKTLIWIRSISYATVAQLQSFSQSGSFFASMYKFIGVFLVIIREVAFIPFYFMIFFSLYWRPREFNIYAPIEYLTPYYPKLYESFQLLLPDTPAQAGVQLIIFAESTYIEKVTTRSSPVFSDARNYHPHRNSDILT